MTKIYNEKKEVKEVVTQTLDHVKCDWCGGKIPTGEDCNDNKPRMETEIKQTVNFSCYESGRGHYWKIEDLCLSCGEKLKEYLKEIGITITEDEFDW